MITLFRLLLMKSNGKCQKNYTIIDQLKMCTGSFALSRYSVRLHAQVNQATVTSQLGHLTGPPMSQYPCTGVESSD